MGSFADFCKLLANNISRKEDPLFIEDEDKKEEVPLHTGKYLKREAFFAQPSLIAVRLNRRLPHEKKCLNKRLTCVYCCSKKHETEADCHNTRLGHKTTFACRTCNVPLCYRKRFDGTSCAELFHSVEEINDPCETGIVMDVRARVYCPPPPSRKRSGNDTPNFRSKTTEYTTPTIRKSGRFS